MAEKLNAPAAAAGDRAQAWQTLYLEGPERTLETR